MLYGGSLYGELTYVGVRNVFLLKEMWEDEI